MAASNVMEEGHSTNQLQAAPAHLLCPHCQRGRLIAKRVTRTVVIGEFKQLVHRECNNPLCQKTIKTDEMFIGYIPVSRPAPSDQPLLFDMEDPSIG